MARAANKRGKRKKPRRPIGRPWPVHLANALTALAGTALVLVVVMAALSWGRPPRVEGEVVRVQVLASGGQLVVGKIGGVFGPFRRGFGQRVGPAGLDLLTDDGRRYGLAGVIEETRWQALVWPPNWWRREIWFTEVIPSTRGFARIRVRVHDRLGNAREGPARPLDGSDGTLQDVPIDVRLWARAARAIGGSSTPIDASSVDLERPLW